MGYVTYPHETTLERLWNKPQLAGRPSRFEKIKARKVIAIRINSGSIIHIGLKNFGRF
jgi:hypothetical protein